MRIADVRLHHVAGTMQFPGEFWEERLIRPIDLYPRFAAEGPTHLPKVAEGQYRIETVFVEIETDDGAVGIGGPHPLQQAIGVVCRLRTPLLQQDEQAAERKWERLYQADVTGRKGGERRSTHDHQIARDGPET